MDLRPKGGCMAHAFKEVWCFFVWLTPNIPKCFLFIFILIDLTYPHDPNFIVVLYSDTSGNRNALAISRR